MNGYAAGGIDCDLHPAVPGMAALLPYLDDYWREQVIVRGIDGFDLASFPLPGLEIGKCEKHCKEPAP